MVFLDFFCGGIVSCFSAETRWAPMLGGIRKSGWDPRTQVKVQCARSSKAMTQEETKNLLKDCLNLKSCESFYTCPHTPFYRETKGLLQSENAHRTRGIFLMWTCTCMSFTSHTFTSLPLVHTQNSDFLRRRLWLCFLLVRESSHSGNLRAPWLPNLSSSRLPNFTDSRFHDFAGSWLRVFTSSRLRGFAGSWLRVFTSSRLRGFVGSRLRIIARSRLLGFASSLFLKTYFTNFMNLDVSRVTGFPEFPNSLTGLPGQIRVRSCIFTWNLYRLWLLLGQDLPTLYLWRATIYWGEHNWIKQTMSLLFISWTLKLSSNLHVVHPLISMTRDGT
jgi:hypothetical protein